MNECIKLQNLLKIYGGTSLRKQFKGFKVTQNFNEKKGFGGRAASYINDRSKSRSPTAKDDHNYLDLDKQEQSNKPKTSIETGNMNLSNGFPAINHSSQAKLETELL